MIVILLLVWQFISDRGIVPKFMLPSPADVVEAFRGDISLLAMHARVTLVEAVIGLFCGVALGVVIAVLMDACSFLEKAVYPLIVITQTVPTIAIAPLLVLWLGYDMLPKIVLIIITTFFPVAVGMFDGLKHADADEICLMKVMGASRLQIFFYVKCPEALSHFFAGLKVSATYSIVGAVISEWLGGYEGLGVYMVRVKKSYAFDKMFAVIFLITAISLLLMWFMSFLKWAAMPWERIKQKES